MINESIIHAEHKPRHNPWKLSLRLGVMMDLSEEGDLQKGERRDNCHINFRFSLCWVS